MKIGNNALNDEVNKNNPVYIIAEIGINHNGSLKIAKQLIDVAVEAGCQAVKFQKRTPDICVPKKQKNKVKQTPWGEMTYLEYKHRVEFGEKKYKEIDIYCKEKGIDWFVSVWDLPSIKFIEKHFEPVAYKIPSAMITNKKLLGAVKDTGRPIIMSTGMSTRDEIMSAYLMLKENKIAIAQCTSTYPAKTEELNLKFISTLKNYFNGPIGYSGHEIGLQCTLAAVALGASFIERHITLDRSMWGTDQSASVEPQGLKKLVRDIRVIEKALGDGRKKVYDSEKQIRQKLRG